MAIEETEAFAKMLKEKGRRVTLVRVESGDHYDSMIEKGIPTAIKWLKGR